MRNAMKFVFAGSAIFIVGCTTGDKGATPADTATGQSTSIAPATTSAPVLSAPVDSIATPVPPKTSGSAPRTSTSPKASTPAKTTDLPMWDSAFKPRATVDEKGNIQPIRRDSL